MSRRWLGWVAWAGALLLSACGGGSSAPGEALEPIAAQPAPPSPSSASAGDIHVLMMGNSHTTVAQLPQQLEALLRAGLPGKRVSVVVAPGSMFLDERLTDPPSMDLLRSREWTAVVLQAQKYSSSGTYRYSTSEAAALVAEARKVKALPVLFPEWARRDVRETETIYALHVSIASQQAACVAPIGQAWDLAQDRMPTLSLHDVDGNHAAVAGAHLTALVLYATITGNSPSGLPLLGMGVDGALQLQLAQAAADTVKAVSPRLHCPSG